MEEKRKRREKGKEEKKSSVKINKQKEIEYI